MKKLIFITIIFNMLFFINAYEETGLASWYGPNFHGKKTASGEIFNTFNYTAAHRTLPFGTYVKVTSIENGKEVIVRINDRGPSIESRIIDLSKVAASKLGFVDQGLMNVKLSIYTPNESDSTINEPNENNSTIDENNSSVMEDIIGKSTKMKIDTTDTLSYNDDETSYNNSTEISNRYDEHIYDLQLGSFKTYHYALDLTVKINKLLNVRPIITNVNINGINMYRVIISDLSKEQVDRYLSMINRNNIEYLVKKRRNE